MKLGDILGSISPAYGLFKGEGLGGMLRYGNLPFLLSQLFGHHGHDNGDQGPAPIAAPPAQQQPQIPLSALLMMQQQQQVQQPPYGY